MKTHKPPLIPTKSLKQRNLNATIWLLIIYLLLLLTILLKTYKYGYI